MKKMTVVRQNRCDEEMRFLLFGSYFLFLAMQKFADPVGRFVNSVNMALYWIFVPGFFFMLGYCYNRQRRMSSEKRQISWLNLSIFKYFLYFFALTLTDAVLLNWEVIFMTEDRSTLLSILADTLAVIRVPAISAVFLSAASALVLARAFKTAIDKAGGNGKKLFFAGAVLLLCAFLRSRQDLYPIVASFFGSDLQPAVPCVPYFAFFLLGGWFEEEKPGFQWKLALGFAAVTAVSLLVYRTPAQNLARVTVSFFPVYLVYAASEGLAELTLRSKLMRGMCRAAEPMFPVYALLVLALATAGFGMMSVEKTLIVAVLLIAVVLAVFLGIWAFFRCYGAVAGRLAKRTRGKTALYFVVYTAVFVFLMFLVFIPFLYHGKTLVWSQDTIPQYYPRAVYFANYIRDLVSGFLHGNFELPMYDFRFGMGSEVVYSMEPLYFLNALFGAEHVETMHTVLILLRFYFAGITSSIFFLYFKKDYFTTFFASVVYVFCGFALYGGARHPMFMIAMIYLPLLILSIEEILRGRRWYLCTIFVALAMFSNYYFLYMSTFGMGVYFLVRYFCGPYKKSLKGFIGKGLAVSGSYLLGLAMSCIILVSNIGVYAGSARSGNAIIKTPSLFYYGEQWLLRCFMSFPTSVNAPGDWLRLGFLPISFFAVIFLFLRKGRRELKTLSVAAVVIMALPLSGFILGGFSAVTNRWCYMLALLTAYIVADCLPEMLRMSRRELLVCGTAAGIYVFFAFFGNCLVTQYTKLAAVLLCAVLGLLAVMQERRSKLSRYGRQCMLLLLTFVMVFHSGFTLFELNSVIDEYAAPGLARSLADNTPLLAAQELEDDSFYRVGSPKLNYRTISSSIMHDYNSIYMFNSTMNGNIMEYLEKMGATSYSVTQFMGFSNRVFMNALAAVKYYANYANNDRPLPFGYEELERTEVNEKETVISENRNALPLGYTYRDFITEEELEQYSVAERQEIMMQKAVVDEETAGKLRDEGRQAEDGEQDLSVTCQRVKLTSTKERGITLLENAMAAGMENTGSADGRKWKKYRLKLKFQGLPNAETYLVLKNAYIEGDMSEQAINLTLRAGGTKYEYKFRPDDDRYGSQQEDYVFNLGYFEEPLDSVMIRMDREGVIRFDSLELYCQPMDRLEEYTQALTEDVLENVEIGTNRVSGDIRLEEDKLLALSIPYQRGWTASVDGEQVELLRANYMYMAIPLEAGEHRIELSYAIPGAKYALVIMPASVVLLIVLCFVTWLLRKRKSNRKASGEQD